MTDRVNNQIVTAEFHGHSPRNRANDHNRFDSLMRGRGDINIDGGSGDDEIFGNGRPEGGHSGRGKPDGSSISDKTHEPRSSYYPKHLFEDKLPSWLRDDRSDTERAEAFQEYNKDIGDRLKGVWELAKIVTFFEKAVFWAPFHSYDKMTGQHSNDSYLDPWHHHVEDKVDPLK